MKIITYLLVLLVFIGLLTGFLMQPHPDGMSMGMMLSISALLVLYVVAMSFVGEGKIVDERDLSHRYFSNRLALLAGTIVLCLGVLYQLFNHNIDYWLLAVLIVINLIKIVSLIYAHYRK